jgi:hypothetical protein
VGWFCRRERPVPAEWGHEDRSPGGAGPGTGSLIAATDPYTWNGSEKRVRSVHQQTRIDFQFFGQPWLSHAIIQ